MEIWRNAFDDHQLNHICSVFAICCCFVVCKWHWKWSHFETAHEMSNQNQLMMTLKSANQLLRLPVSYFCKNNPQRSNRERRWINQMIPLGTELKSRFSRSKLLCLPHFDQKSLLILSTLWLKTCLCCNNCVNYLRCCLNIKMLSNKVVSNSIFSILTK